MIDRFPRLGQPAPAYNFLKEKYAESPISLASLCRGCYTKDERSERTQKEPEMANTNVHLALNRRRTCDRTPIGYHEIAIHASTNRKTNKTTMLVTQQARLGNITCEKCKVSNAYKSLAV